MTREELVKAVWEEQHRQHGLVRRKHHGPPPDGAQGTPPHGPHGEDGHKPPHGEGPGHRPPARQEHLLHILKKNPSINQKDFAEKLHVRPQSLGEMLAKMEENGLIVRKKDPSDGRAILVDLTPAGEALEQEHHEKVFKDITARYSALTDEELAEYLRLTQKINDTLESQQTPE